MTETTTSTTTTLSPFYASPVSMKTLMASLKENGVPGRIDRHVLKSFSNAVGSQILAGLKFLGLVDEARAPTQALLDLVDAYGTDRWAPELEAVLRRAYGSLFALNLATATPGQFNEAFTRLFSVEGETARKASSFFLTMAGEAQIELSKYLTANKKPRSASPKKRMPRATPRSKEKEDDADANGALNGAPVHHGRPLPGLKPSEMLLSHLKDMGPSEQEAAWVLMKHFAAKNL